MSKPLGGASQACWARLVLILSSGSRSARLKSRALRLRGATLGVTGLLRMRSAPRWVVLLAVWCGCTTSQNIGSRYLATVLVSPIDGGILEVSAQDSAELAGLKLTFPSGAVEKPTLVGIELSATSLLSGTETSEGPGAVLSPAMTLLADAQLELTLPAGYDGTSAETTIFVSQTAGVEQVVAPKLVVANGKVRAPIRTLGTVEIAARYCLGTTACPTGQCNASGRCNLVKVCLPTAALPTGCASTEQCLDGWCVDASADCTPALCGPIPGSPACTCPDGSAGCNTGQCLRQAGSCVWEYRICP